jgi:tight adherence protein C
MVPTALIPTLTSLAVAVGVMLLFYGLYVERRPSMAEERLKRYVPRPRTLLELELQKPFTERILRPLLRVIALLAQRLTPGSNLERIRLNLIMAGSPGGLQALDFVGLKGLAAIIMGLLAYGLMWSAGAQVYQRLLFLLAMAGIGYVAPSIWLGGAVKARQAQIRRNLPDVLDLLNISVEAGLGFDQAVSRVAEKWDTPLCLELRRYVSQLRLGMSRKEALRELATRTGVDEVNQFVVAIVQAEQLGVGIAKVLRIQAEQMRIRRRQLAEELARKAPIKMIIPMVTLIFPTIYIVIFGPALPLIFNVFKK